ncbi:MAG: alpha/beta hydrolase [Nitriliruptoraceae bacterium]|nr:alpha/beta hydrolase [Nitriliruptoraceae bacterium]
MELQADVTGSGPVTVLLHGITESMESFAPLVGALATRGTVVRVDLRGHGRSPTAEVYDPASMAADVHRTLAGLELAEGDPLVIGHSMGGLVAVAYASAFPTRGVIDVDQPLDLAGFQAQVRQLEPLLRGDGFDEAIAMVFGAMTGPLDTAEVARLDTLRRADRDVVLGVWGPLLEQPAEALDAMVGEIAAGVRTPVLSLHGIDPGPAYAGWLAERIPTAAVEVWPDHGHYPHLVDPTRFLDRVAAFDAATAG